MTLGFVFQKALERDNLLAIGLLTLVIYPIVVASCLGICHFLVKLDPPKK